MVCPVRGSESQSLSGSHIQFTGDFVAFCLSDFAHAHSFGEILPKQSVEVFVGTPLPRVIRGCEVALDRMNLLDDLVIMKLGTVVERDRLEAPSVLRDGHHGGLVDLGHRAARQLLDDGHAGLALHQGQHTMVLVRADDGVTLPVPNSLPSFDLSGAFTDVPFARHDASVIDAAVALASKLGNDPRVAPQRATLGLVSQDVTVDRAVTDVQLCPQAQHTRDLLRAPLLAKQGVNVGPVSGLEQGPATTSPTPGLRVLLRLRRPVRAVIPRGVPSHFSADRRGTSPHFQRDQSHTRATAQTRGNEVSFLSGELVIRQGCSPCLAGKRKQQYLRSPPYSKQVLHFGCQSAQPNCAVKGTKTAFSCFYPPRFALRCPLPGC